MRCQLARAGEVYTWLLDRLFPPACALCGDPPGRLPELCDPCGAELPWIATACPVCARPGPVMAPCGRCIAEPPAFDAAFAPLAYTSPVSQLVQQLKYQGHLHLVRPLSSLLAEALCARRKDPLPQLLVPVPLHPRRLRERGFNQTVELARPVAARLGMKLDRHLVRRVRDAPPQASLPHPRRKKNIRGAFATCATLDGIEAAILDDVITTGTTAGELARCLRRAGAARVEVWAMARA